MAAARHAQVADELANKRIHRKIHLRRRACAPALQTQRTRQQQRTEQVVVRGRERNLRGLTLGDLRHQSVREEQVLAGVHRAVLHNNVRLGDTAGNSVTGHCHALGHLFIRTLTARHNQLRAGVLTVDFNTAIDTRRQQRSHLIPYETRTENHHIVSLLAEINQVQCSRHGKAHRVNREIGQHQRKIEINSAPHAAQRNILRRTRNKERAHNQCHTGRQRQRISKRKTLTNNEANTAIEKKTGQTQRRKNRKNRRNNNNEEREHQQNLVLRHNSRHTQAHTQQPHGSNQQPAHEHATAFPQVEANKAEKAQRRQGIQHHQRIKERRVGRRKKRHIRVQKISVCPLKIGRIENSSHNSIPLYPASIPTTLNMLWVEAQV